MSMNDIEVIIMFHRNRSSDHGVVSDLLHQIRSVFAGELEFLTDMYLRGLPRNKLIFLYYFLELFRVNVWNHVRPYFHETDFVQELVHRLGDVFHGHIASVDDFRHAAILVSGSRRHHEQRFNPIVGQSLNDSIAGSS